MTDQAMPAGTWRGRHGPQVIADVFSRAAALIDRHGYDGHRNSRARQDPFSLSLAVETAAGEIYVEQQNELGIFDVDYHLLAEAADQRLAGLLVFTGQVMIGRSCEVDLWDGASPQHSKMEAIAVLGQAAFICSFISGMAVA